MDQADWFSKSLFLWVQPLLRTGYKRPLQEHEALALPRRLHPGRLFLRFEELWQRQCTESEQYRPRRGPSVPRVLWQIVGNDVRCALFMQVCCVGIQVCYVVLLRRLTQFLTDDNANEQRGLGIGIAIGLGVLNLLEGNLFAHATFRFQLATHQVVILFAEASLWKGTKLHPEVQHKYPRGNIVSLALSETTRLLEISSMVLPGFTAPIIIFAALVVMLVYVGPEGLVSALFVFAILCVVDRVGKAQGKAFRRKSECQGRRMAVLNEMLQSARFTKYYGIEEHFQRLMASHREKELGALLWMKIPIGFLWPAASVVSLTVGVSTLLTYLLAHGELPSKDNTAVVLACARMMYTPCAFFGNGLAAVNMVRVACTRLQTFLLQRDIKRRPVLPPVHVEEKIGVSISQQNFSWVAGVETPPTLKDITLHVPRGELWAIVGELSSGKSSLLMSILGDVEAVPVELSTDVGAQPPVLAYGDSRTYVAQEPMIINASVRDNVLFGLSMPTNTDHETYEAALGAAALHPDLQALPAGDMTEIGERGITLSGGQKARVAMARAVLGSCGGGLVLLDDPLAAVDAHVGVHLFDKCICQALKGRTRILVTNQLQFLNHPAVSQVVVMENGAIVEQGNFKELSLGGQHFSRLLASVGSLQQWNEMVVVPNRSHEPEATSSSNVPSSSKGHDGCDAPREANEGKLVEKEHKAEGAVSVSTFQFYISLLGGNIIFMLMVLWCWGFHLTEIAPDLLFAIWQDDVLGWRQEAYAVGWIVVGLASLVLHVACRQATVLATMRVSRRIHAKMLTHTIHATMGFFDKTPSGRIMNRFGEDLAITDWTAALQLEVVIICFWRCVDYATVPVFAQPWVAPVAIVAACLFLWLREVNRRTCREAIRWWMVTKSPVFSIFEEMVSGITTICAMGQEKHFRARFHAALHNNVSWLLSRDAINMWTNQRLAIFSASIVTALAMLLVLMPSKRSTYIEIMGLVYALILCESLRFVSFFLVQVEGTFASVERVREFTSGIEQEPSWWQPGDNALKKVDWPAANADLVFESVSVRYFSHLPLALRGLSVHVAANEKVGIVGRTGSGKSTLLGTLFRIVPIEEGKILFGGVDTASVGLVQLRKRITIVPQDPVLFSGDLRRNLDPLSEHSEVEVDKVLQRCGLDVLVEGFEGGLSAYVAQGGTNFSVGERQVLCLARALLRRNRLLCLDEATANVDPSNDARIQRILGEEVTDSIVLTIAHRLRTVLGNDRIIVLDAGSVAQCDSPKILLQQAGMFRELATSAGIDVTSFGSNSVQAVSTFEQSEHIASI